MDNKKKKSITIVTLIVVVSVAIIGAAYAVFTANQNRRNKFHVGTLDIEILNLDLKKNETSTRTMMPGDIDVVSYRANNRGTSAALTRHTIDIYWKNVADINEITQLPAETLFSLYPASMSNEEIMADFNGTGSAKITENLSFLSPTAIEKQIEIGGNTVTVYGLRYKFLGNTLLGSDGVVIDGVESTYQDISYKLLLNPRTSYLYQEEPIGIDVVLEAMQYTEDGSGTWTITDSEGL